MLVALSNNPVMSSELRSAVQFYVMFHIKTNTASSLITQDADIDLAF